MSSLYSLEYVYQLATEKANLEFRREVKALSYKAKSYSN